MTPPDPDLSPPPALWAADLARLRALVDQEAARLLIAGVLVGALGGLAAGLFDHGLITVGQWVLGTAEPAEVAPVWWRALLGPAGCGLIAGALIGWGTRLGRPQAPPDVMARVQLNGGLSLRDGLVSAASAMVAVGGGQSGGREGPIVQLASTLAGAICGRLGLAERHSRSLIAAGAAAGVAASFNTPVGGAFFALEILLGDFGVEAFAPVVAATVTGTVVGQALLGDRIALHLPPFSLGSPLELVFYLALGALSGAVAVGFKRALDWGADRQDPWGLPLPLRTGLMGLGVGTLAAVGLHPVMGNGYVWMETAISEPQAVGAPLLLSLLVAKVVATTLTAMGRSGAGIFAPSLYLGAVTGLLSGKVFSAIAPWDVSSVGAYGMVGMGAVTAGVLHAPITMTLMLFEMTGNYEVILPLLVSLSAAGLVSRLLGSDSVYEAELARRGLKLPRRSDRPADPLDGLPPGQRLALVDVPPALVGKTLAEVHSADWTAVAHHRHHLEPPRWESLPPDPSRTLVAGDRLLVAASGELLDASGPDAVFPRSTPEHPLNVPGP